MAKYSNQSHEVVALFLTRGEIGIAGKSPQETAAIRTNEAIRSCALLKARPVFANQVDGDTEIDSAQYDEFRKILEAEGPDIVFTHWPIDSHRDHRIASLLTYDAWLQSKAGFVLYYYEAELGEQTQNFWPNHYVDISETQALKWDALHLHSTTISVSIESLHKEMERFADENAVTCLRKRSFG